VIEVGFTPKNLPLVLTCYHAKFGGSAAMSLIAELKKMKILTLKGPLLRGAGGPKLNFIVVGPI